MHHALHPADCEIPDVARHVLQVRRSAIVKPARTLGNDVYLCAYSLLSRITLTLILM